MTLHHRTLGDEHVAEPPVIILHGVFGTSDNWQTFGKALAERRRVVLVDQRNHGQSPHSTEFNYPAMADDLKMLIEQEQLNDPVVLGHSMGGKTAMFFAVQHPALLSKLIVVDIAPRAYSPHHQAVLDAFAAVDIDHIQSRTEAEDQMKSLVAERGVRQFLLKNLQRTDDGFAWKLNLPVIRDNIEAVGAAVPNDEAVEIPALFVRGAKSDYIQEEDQELIKRIFPQARTINIEEAGHWVHAEQPNALLEAVNSFLDEPADK
ncbi:MAG: alpha/beta fold hydrolase [Tunicatimonas sp.]